MAAVMTLGAPPTSRVHSGLSLGRVAVVFAIVLSIFAITATPAVDVVPDPVSSAVSAIVPDSIESMFAAADADALSFRTYWSGFDMTFTKGEISWLGELGYTAATAAVCGWLAATIIGAVVCGVAAWGLWKYGFSYWNGRMIDGTCVTLGVRWYGHIHKNQYHWC